MSISEQIQALQTDKTNIANAITTKGGTVASGDGFDDFATDIATIPTGITPTGTISITSNGTTDVTNYASADVNVSPSLQFKFANENGNYYPDEGFDGFSDFEVSVYPELEDKTITENGTYTAGSDYYGLGTVEVNVQSSARLKDISPVTANGTYKVLDDLILVDKFTCTGNGYFPTDIVLPDANVNTVRLFEFVFYPALSGILSYVFGADGTAGKVVFGYYNSRYQFNNGYRDASAYYSFTEGTETTVVTTTSGVKINGTTMSGSGTTASTGLNTLDILGYNSSSGHSGFFKGDFVYLKIKDINGNLLYHFVPARNANNEPLLLDKVAMKTYSYTGTGLTLGNDVSDESYDGFKSPIVVSIKKYGATINGLFGNIDSSGTYILPSEVTNLDFTGIVSLPDSAFYYKFANQSNINSASFPNLTTANPSSLRYAFQNSGITSFSAPNLTTIGSYGIVYMCDGCTNLTGEINLDNLTTLNSNYNCRYAFQNTAITKLSVNGLTTIPSASTYCFSYICQNCTGALKVYFNGLTSVNSAYAFDHGFYQAKKMTDIEFNNLETISGNYAFSNAFYNGDRDPYKYKVWHCMPKLKTINSNSVFSSAFGYNGANRVVFDSLEYIGNLTANTTLVFYQAFQFAYLSDGTQTSNIDKQGLFFPSLKVIGQNSTGSNRNFSNCFVSANDRNSMHFYELTTVYNTSSSSSYGQFYNNAATRIYMPKVTDLGTYNQYCFSSSSYTKQIHFGKENQATIEALSGYSSKFGANYATLYFDMINHITYGGVVYDRDGPDCDLDNWYFAYKDANDNVIYVTNFNDPAVGDSVYTKSGTTYTAVGTVEAVA